MGAMGYKIVRMTRELFECAFTEGATFPNAAGQQLRITAGLPEGARLEAINESASLLLTGDIVMRFSHPSWPDVPQGVRYPEIRIEYALEPVTSTVTGADLGPAREMDFAKTLEDASREIEPLIFGLTVRQPDGVRVNVPLNIDLTPEQIAAVGAQLQAPVVSGSITLLPDQQPARGHCARMAAHDAARSDLPKEEAEALQRLTFVYDEVSAPPCPECAQLPGDVLRCEHTATAAASRDEYRRLGPEDEADALKSCRRLGDTETRACAKRSVSGGVASQWFAEYVTPERYAELFGGSDAPHVVEG